jgi:hypothetical protein
LRPTQIVHIFIAVHTQPIMPAKLFAILFFLFISLSAACQQWRPASKPDSASNNIQPISEDTVGLRLRSLDVDARFPGGPPAWNDYIKSHVKTTVAVDNKAPDGVYTVVVRFIIVRDGHLAEVVAETKHGYGMEAELMMAIKRSPTWIPAMKGGKAVGAYKREMVRFVVGEGGD